MTIAATYLTERSVAVEHHVKPQSMHLLTETRVISSDYDHHYPCLMQKPCCIDWRSIVSHISPQNHHENLLTK